MKKKQKNQITAARLVRNKLILRSLRDNLTDQQKTSIKCN